MMASTDSTATKIAPTGGKNVLTIFTGQVDTLKAVTTALKEIIIDTSIVFSPQGIKILNTDKTIHTMVHLNLFADKFEFFECTKNKIIEIGRAHV